MAAGIESPRNVPSDLVGRGIEQGMSQLLKRHRQGAGVWVGMGIT